MAGWTGSETPEDGAQPESRPPLAHPRRVVTVVTALLALSVLLLMELRGVKTDTDVHIARVLPMMLDGAWVGNFLYYVLVGVPALLHPHESTVRLLTIGLLVLCVAWKARLILRILAEGHEQHAASLRWVAALTVGTCLAWSLPTPRLLLGQFPPNIWHNATLMLLFPFALVAWWESTRYLVTGDPAHLRALAWSVPLGVAAKPSFFFAYAPVFGVALLVRWGLRRPAIRGLLPLVAGAAIVGVQYLLVYVRTAGNPYVEEKGPRSLAIDPLFAMSQHSLSLPISLLASFAFPLTYALLRPRRVLARPLLAFSFALLLVALVIGALVVETGSGRVAGNFLWQIFVCNLLVFVACLRDLLPDLLQPAARRDRNVAWLSLGVFGLHVLAGVAYIAWGLAVKGRSIYI